MQCRHFGECGSCTLDMPYDEQLEIKAERIKSSFEPFYKGELEIFASDEMGYRSRAEFGLWHEGDELFYTMGGANGDKVKIKECPKVSEKIASLMPLLLASLKANEKLKSKIFGVEFIATNAECLAVLLYHKKLDGLSGELASLAKELNIKLVARSRGQRLFFAPNDLEDELLITKLELDNKSYIYKFSEGAFIQPNAKVNQKMIGWALKCISKPADLLELYCGYGNFTIALSTKFNQVLATEISKQAIKSALINAKINGVSNIKFLRMDADELMSAFRGEREFNRLKEIDLKSYNFSHILVDPPRAGLSSSVIDFIKNFSNIIYISCNPATLKRDIELLDDKFKIKKMAFFDQFAHTNHAECGVLLSKKE